MLPNIKLLIYILPNINPLKYFIQFCLKQTNLIFKKKSISPN